MPLPAPLSRPVSRNVTMPIPPAPFPDTGARLPFSGLEPRKSGPDRAHFLPETTGRRARTRAWPRRTDHSRADTTFSTAEATVSVPDLILCVTDQTFSIADKTLSAPDLTFSVADQTFSTTEAGFPSRIKLSASRTRPFLCRTILRPSRTRPFPCRTKSRQCWTRLRPQAVWRHPARKHLPVSASLSFQQPHAQETRHLEWQERPRQTPALE